MRLLVLLLVITSTLATSEFLGSYDRLKDSLSSIDETVFGRNLLDTIALQMDSNSPMMDIANMIREMMNDLRS